MKKSAAREDQYATRTQTPAPEWTRNEWWDKQARALPEWTCERNSDHGPARVFDHANFAGRVLGYNCSICGWEKAMIVQEGQLEPCAPATELPAPTKEHLRRVALGQKGARVRAEKFAKRQRLLESEE